MNAPAPKNRLRRLPTLLALVVLLLASLPAAHARPGGGHSFSGGSHSSGSRSGGFSRGSSSGSGIFPSSGYRGGSSGGTGCGGIGCFLLLVVIVIIVVIILAKRGKGSAPPSPPPPQAPPPPDLDGIRALDPEFSVVLFEDFAYALYARAHQARSSSDALDALAPYLSPEARAHLAGRKPVGAPVEGVVIGTMHATSITLPDAAASQYVVILEFETNMTVGAGTGDATQYVRERWRLVRDGGVASKPPAAVGSFHCPNCGAPFEPTGGGDRCSYCGEAVTGGRFDWSVQAIALLEQEDRPPALTGTTEEVGTDFPTIVHPAAAERRAELLADDAATTDEALWARLHLIYGELNDAWSALELAPIRPFVSDSLFDYLQYWITAYRSQGLRNVLTGMHITRWQLAKVIRDQHFDSLTFRIWGSGRDTTIEQASGRLVGGNPNRDRDYSEYWTLIRGAAVRGAPRADKNCPNCAAPLEVNMSGGCEHCGAKVTRGEFDWVLSKIEQDESYTG